MMQNHVFHTDGQQWKSMAPRQCDWCVQSWFEKNRKGSQTPAKWMQYNRDVVSSFNVQVLVLSTLRHHRLLLLKCCGDWWASSPLIICHLTVYQSQRIPSCLCELWIFLLYGVINFPWIISPHTDPCFDECSWWLMHTMCFLLLRPATECITW